MFAKLYISPSGRCSRRFYWLLGVLPFVVAGMIIETMWILLHINPDAVLVPVLVLAWPSLAMQIKRWHDINRSGWFALLGIVPYLNIATIIGIGLIRGTHGSNRYGPDPVSDTNTAVRAV